MRKFLISDYDGTFHIDDESTKYNVEKVKKFRNQGNLFAIATGRSYYHFSEAAAPFQIEYDYLISDSGAVLLNHQHQLIKYYPIDNQAKLEIIHEFHLEDNENIFACKCLESKTSIHEENITKIHIRCRNQEELLRIHNTLNLKYSDFVKSYPLTGLKNCLEIMSSDTDKSMAIRELARLEGVEEKNIFTAGDSFNDLEMLETFQGFCMKSSEEFIKSRIRKSFASVAEVIDEIMKNGDA